MRRLVSITIPILTLLASTPLMAQDFGRTWIDRITHDVVEDTPTLSPHPVEWKFNAGELISYDSNVFLTHSNREDDVIFTTFAGGNVKYSEATFDAEADLLINYNAYASINDVNADEERFYGRVRYQGTKVTLSISEVARRETSPTDVVFTTRAPRFISDTLPLVIVKPSEVIAVELQSNLELVDYLRTAFSGADNFNTRTLLTLAYTTGWNKVDLLVQVGYFGIAYKESFAPPDASGYIGHLGLRGEVTEKLYVFAAFGVSKADSDDYPATGNDSQLTTMDAEVHLVYTLSSNSIWYADYSRRFGFAADGSSFQVVDSAAVTGTLTMREDLTLRGRLQYDRSHSDIGLRRAYYSFGVGADWKIHQKVVIDAGITYRAGVAPGSGNAGDFGDVILSAGAAVLF